MKTRTFPWNSHHSSYHHFTLLTFLVTFLKSSLDATCTSVPSSYFVICEACFYPCHFTKTALTHLLILFSFLDPILGKYNDPLFMWSVGCYGSLSCLIPGSRRPLSGLYPGTYYSYSRGENVRAKWIKVLMSSTGRWHRISLFTSHWPH